MPSHASKSRSLVAASRVLKGASVHGGAVLGLTSHRALDLVAEVQRGLPYGAFERFQEHTRLPLGQLATWTGIRERTLARRKREGRLQPDESDRLLRAARLYSSALRLCGGDARLAVVWLGAPQPGLGGERPLDLAATEVGTAAVEALIGRVEHGIPS